MNTFYCVTSRSPFLLAMLLAVASLSGCGKSDPAPFVVNQWPRQQLAFNLEKLHENFNAAKDDKELQTQLAKSIKQANDALGGLNSLAQHRANVLEALFGTPDEPYVHSKSGLDLDKLQRAAGPTASDQFGDVKGLYRRHCVHCHGISGDGAGPTAVFLNPYPRDFRYGTFKFKSTTLGDKPTDDDLRRVLTNGIANTAMPSFKTLLSDADTAALIEYVKYLSHRGEMEVKLIDFIDATESENADADADAKDAQAAAKANPGDADKAQIAREAAAYAKEVPSFDEMTKNPSEFQAAIIEGLYEPIAKKWKAASTKIVVPTTDRAAHRSDEEIRTSITAGRKLFYGKVANCFSCHGPSALGDGTTYLLNEKPGKTDRFPKDGFNKIINWELSPMTLRPRNLRIGHIRGGRRPLDIYRRIRVGIDGTPMPGLDPSILSDEKVWQLVDYVLTLPYELNNPTTSDHQVENSRRVH